MKNLRTIVWAVPALFSALTALATDKVLTINATGMISPAPVWQNGAGVEISNINFDFGGRIAREPATDVDSAATVAKLVNATTYPATVSVLRPAGCKIGTAAIDDKFVQFLNNGTAVTSDANISVSSAGEQSYALRFSSAGNYGDKSGSVSCATSGKLTFSY